eukprot:480228-Rhodomonas_salina.1
MSVQVRNPSLLSKPSGHPMLWAHSSSAPLWSSASRTAHFPPQHLADSHSWSPEQVAPSSSSVTGASMQNAEPSHTHLVSPLRATCRPSSRWLWSRLLATSERASAITCSSPW